LTHFSLNLTFLLQHHPDLFSPDAYNFIDFERAYLLVNSRCFKLVVNEGNRDEFLPMDGVANTTISNGTELRVMVPFADMFNHHPVVTDVRPAYMYNNETDVWEMIADSDYNAGDEVFIVYMESSNAELLHHYNFVPRDNPFDTVAVDLNKHFPLCPPGSDHQLCMMKQNWAQVGICI